MYTIMYLGISVSVQNPICIIVGIITQKPSVSFHLQLCAKLICIIFQDPLCLSMYKINHTFNYDFTFCLIFAEFLVFSRFTCQLSSINMLVLRWLNIMILWPLIWMHFKRLFPNESVWIWTDGEDVTATPDTKELSRPRLDTGLSIYTQMTSIFHELPSPSSNSKPSTKLDSPLEKLNSDGDMTIIHIAEPGDELVSIFASRNVLSLQQLGGGDVLLDVCMELQSLKSYADGVQKALLSGQPLEFSTTVMEAMCVRSM